ncbi:MAG: ferrous iron transporter B [Prevotella sp.]|nr:ferrous iron transporter B [Staphylococcus sp.]MCM1350011.1 ferrous iron transporter B [Prevotella sp.]
MKFALAGNPNCGKTTLFNGLTGATAHVGNWPGVTVDKREGVYKKLAKPVQIVDLPGIYSLSPYTPEEIISRNFIVDEKPDCVINVIDATNLERNLYLTTQLLEIDVPIVIALNMMDTVRKNGDVIQVQELENMLHVPVIEISALKNEGIKELMKMAYEEASQSRKGISVLSETSMGSIIERAQNELDLQKVASPLFHAIKLIEGDSVERALHSTLVEDVENMKKTIDASAFDGDFEGMIADARYKYIAKHFVKTVKKSKASEQATKSDKIDRVLTHRIWSIPLFLLVMFVVFHFVFSEDLLFLNSLFGIEISNPGWINFFTGMGYEDILAEAMENGEAAVLAGIPSLGVFLQSWMGWITGSIIDLVSSFMPEGTWYTGLICDGLLTGLDAIFSFLPQILLLFLFISILEDSGYMARVAFIMDRAFRKFGLSGKAFIPLLMGFGCSVPAMMATKTLEDEKERDLAIRLSPFFSCGAKAPIWAMLAAVVVGSFLGDIFVFSIYVLGIVVAILSALIMKAFSKNSDVPPFIMELPSYHMPQFKNLMAHLWEKFKHFIYKASTIITASIIVIWFLSNFKWAFWTGMVDDISESILADLGRVLQYVFYPCGWSWGNDGWKYTVASITGLIAKEDVVGTMSTLGLTEDTIALSNVAIYAFAAYNLFTLPCFAAVATAKGESTKKGFLVTMAWWLGASYVISMAIFWIGKLFEIGWYLGLLVLIILVVAMVFLGRYVAKKRKMA